MKGFEFEDSNILGFVLDCEIQRAITFDELKIYFDMLVLNNSVDDLPIFIWDLLDLTRDEKLHIDRIIGFSPGCNLTKSENNAIYGIAVKRFKNIKNLPISKKLALAELERNPHILERFKETFPFIKMEDQDDVLN